MSRPRDWAILHGMPDDVIRDYKSLPSGRLLTTALTQNEIAIIEGDFYHSFQVVTVLADGFAYLKLTTPTAASGKIFGLVMREIGPTLSGIWYRVFSGATGIVTAGTPWDSFNENGISDNVSASVFQSVSSFTDKGALSDIAYSAKGTTGAKIQGSLERKSGLKILPVESDILVEIENLNNGDNEVLIYYQWVEMPANITG